MIFLRVIYLGYLSYTSAESKVNRFTANSDANDPFLALMIYNGKCLRTSLTTQAKLY